MRVNITYSVDLESVPTEVNKLMVESEATLHELGHRLNLATQKSSLETIEHIRTIREVLVSLDSRLGDCANILSGYIDMKTKITTGHEPLVPAPLEVEPDE
tara:strand:- start:2706 stop:3008 length:303 start_codon:yes stop_codon:yes gene_type:complete